MRFPLVVSAAYAMVSALWISLSDRAVAGLFASRVTEIQTYKGWVFILVTACLLFVVLWREDRRRQGIEAALREQSAAAKQAEVVMRQAKDEAERADQVKSRFLAAASHDLRQPMQSMFLFLEVVSGAVQDAKARKALGFLEQSLNALKFLLDSLLDIARLEAGRTEPQVAAFPMADLVAHLDVSFGALAAEKGLGWRVSPACAAVDVRSDPTLLGRLLRNLVENALRYTPAGEVWLECRTEGPLVWIEVHDTGIGIPPEHLERIWEEFHQVANPQRDRSQGLGLGLAIVRRLASLLGHEVRVRSEPGRGSVFAVGVPLAAAKLGPAAVQVSDARAEKALVLVVDDEPIVLQGLRMTLLDLGYDVLSVGSSDEAMRELHEAGRAPDVVLADYRLPGGQFGTDLIARVRETCGVAVPGTVLTGESGPACREAAAALGLGCEEKPITPRQLDLALRQLLDAA
jgi:signal transduction histidine kinase/ActR/RegA family two-component response regulator